MSAPDVVVVGSGPNGLAAAVTLARAGLGVEVHERAATPGGGCRSEELTIEGFTHDVCSTVHPLLVASPFFRAFDLDALGVKLKTPRVAVAHPLDDGRGAAIFGSVDDTADTLGADRAHYRRIFGPLVRDADVIAPALLAPIRAIPTPIVPMARFGLRGLLPASRLAAGFATDEAAALVSGIAAHSMLPLTAPLTGAFGLFLAMLAHAVGWPVVEGGSSRIVDALASELTSLGGTIVTSSEVTRLDELPPARATMVDLTPRQLVALADDALSPRSRRSLERFRYGPGVCKVDWALSGPVPWRAEVCREAGTVHLGGTVHELLAGEAEVAAGRHPDAPYVIVTQPTIIDATRAPAGCHTLWAYCHVPARSTVDMTGRIEAQIERAAPGFKDLVLSRTTRTAADVAAHNPNYIGGDINSGAATLRQTVFRPTVRWNPYRTAVAGVYLCSASTPPGGGVHGMCGFAAAQALLSDLARGR